MAENQENNRKNEYDNVRNKFSGKSGGGSGGKRPFNFYWIYAIIGVLLISINLFQFGGSTLKTTNTEFEKWVENGQVERIVVVNGDRPGGHVEVYITKEALEEEPHSEKITGNAFTGSKEGPHYQFTAPSMFQCTA